MPQRVVKQPNGLLAYFSTISDSFLTMNLTEAEMERFVAMEWGNRTAREKVDRGLLDETEHGQAGPGLYRWHAALASIRHEYGMKKYKEVCAWGTEPYEPPSPDETGGRKE